MCIKIIKETFHFSNGHFYRVRQNPSPYRNYHRHPQYRRQPTQRQHPANYYREDVQNEICNNAVFLCIICFISKIIFIHLDAKIVVQPAGLGSLEDCEGVIRLNLSFLSKNFNFESQF